MVLLTKIMDSTHANGNLSNNDNERKDEFDNNCTDDKVCVYKTVVSGRYVKQEPCDTEDDQGNIHYDVNIKDEIIEDPTIVIQETRLTTDAKESYLMCCDECGEKYDLYCLKCSTLVRIFNSNYPNANDSRVRRTLPTNFIDIRQTPSDVGIIALRAIPKGTVFGPFEGLDSTKDGAASKWKLKNKELVYTKDPKRLNWMQYVRRADQSSHQNLTPFQYDDGLYYRSDCHISVGDELLTCWNTGNEENTIEDVEDIYWKPPVCERLDDTYACTLCCVGYKSLSHLEAHNSSCPEKGNEMDFCKEIIQCAFCKIYLDEKEYSDYHIDRCWESNPKQYSLATARSSEDTDKPELKDKYKCSMCEYSTSKESKFRHHQLRHTDLRTYKCPDCPYRTSRKLSLQKHVCTHANCNRRLFECEHCGERFARSHLFAVHQKKAHSVSVYKCDKCVFESSNARSLENHMAKHKGAKAYCCNACGKQFKSKSTLIDHNRIYHSEKQEYKCPKCDYETTNPTNIKSHILNKHGGVQRFKCSRCAFKTCYKITLDRHLRYHEDAKPTKCKSCDMEFWNKRSLFRHEELHAITDYSCWKCEYRTRHKYDFNQHLVKVHNGPKLFACTLCPYKTTVNSILKRHIASHSEDKPFACTLCPYITTKKRNLKQHAVTHSDDKPYACTLCPYKTAIKSGLKQHVAIHNNDEPFKCDTCAQMFKRKSYLAKHTRNMHSQVTQMAVVSAHNEN